MALTIKELEHIASLCRLQLTEQEKQKYAAQMDEILEFVWQLDEVDVEWVEPLAHPLEGKYITLRQGVKEFEHKKDLIKNNVKHPIKDNGIVIKSPIKS